MLFLPKNEIMMQSSASLNKGYLGKHKSVCWGQGLEFEVLLMQVILLIQSCSLLIPLLIPNQLSMGNGGVTVISVGTSILCYAQLICMNSSVVPYTSNGGNFFPDSCSMLFPFC